MKRRTFTIPVLFLIASFSFVGFAFAASEEVTVIWDTRSSMVSELVTGFNQRIKELAPELKVKMYPELKSFDEAKKIFHQAEKDSAGIVFLRSSGAQYLSTIQPKVPCFIGACNLPREFGLIESLHAPEGMVTGVTYFIPYERRIDYMRELFPKVRSVAFIGETGHPSTKVDSEGTAAECRRLGISFNEVTATHAGELLQKIKQLNVDLFILGTSRLAMDNVTNILTIANPKKIPIFSYAENPIQSGATACIAADDYKLGRMLAESVVEVVVNKKPVTQIPVKMDSDPKKLVNKSML